MNSFWTRLKYYGIGFAIGLLFVFIFFENRGCSWLPANRVKNSFLDRLIVIPESEEIEMKQRGVTAKDVILALNTGDVAFSESKKADPIKVYAVDVELPKKGNTRFYFTLPKESFICEVLISPSSAMKVRNSDEGTGRIIHFPKDEQLVFIESDPLLKCQLDKLNLAKEKDLLKRLKSIGEVDFAQSNFKVKPKPRQTLVIRNTEYGAVYLEAVWYKNKINVTSLRTEKALECQ